MSNPGLNCNLWVTDFVSPWDVYQHGIRRVIEFAQTPFQQMAIVESGGFGKALVLDGKWQSSTADEFLYHEPLIHVAAVSHGRPRKVLVLGGGEGAAVREALKWNCVERVVMVEIDEKVVNACREHLPEMHQGAFDDPRTELVLTDALGYLHETDEQWDLIISDLSDPIEDGPSFKLFTKECFQNCRRALAKGGYFVIQAGPLSPPVLSLHARLANTLAHVFKHAASFGSHIPSYPAPWGFVVASDRPIEQRPDPEVVDALLAEKTCGEFKMFDGAALLGLMQQPKHIRDAIAAETTVYTLSNPPRIAREGTGEQEETRD